MSWLKTQRSALWDDVSLLQKLNQIQQSCIILAALFAVLWMFRKLLVKQAKHKITLHSCDHEVKLLWGCHASPCILRESC